MCHSKAAPGGARRGGRAALLPVVLLCAQSTFCSARRAQGDRSLLSVEGGGASFAAGFSCPAFCQECCKADGLEGRLEGSSQDRFRCVLRHPARGVPVGCANASEAGNAVFCPFTEDEKRHRVWTSAPSLQWGCSKRYRCCCSATGLDACIGDVTPKERLMEAYNLPERALLALSEDNPALDRYDARGRCPKGFADHDASGRMCVCSDGCQDAPRDPPPLLRGLSTDSLDVQMASLAHGIYTLESPVAGWELVKAWTVSQVDADLVGIYRKRTGSSRGRYTCALVFSGTNSAGNVVEDLEFVSTSFCGYEDVHDGFAKKAEGFTKGVRIEEFASYLASKRSCGGGVYTVGHSLGGAVATLVAACFNKKAAASGDPNAPVVHAVHTVGAPGPAKHPLEDAMSKDGSGCFRGSRHFNEDRFVRDPIPDLGGPEGYKHARIAKVRLWQHGDGSVESDTTECNSTSGGSAGSLLDPLTTLAGGFAVHLPDLKLHPVHVYIRRLIRLQDNGGVR